MWLCRYVIVMRDEHTSLIHVQLLHGKIDQTFMNSLHGLLNFEIGGLDFCVITTDYTKLVH